MNLVKKTQNHLISVFFWYYFGLNTLSVMYKMYLVVFHDFTKIRTVRTQDFYMQDTDQIIAEIPCKLVEFFFKQDKKRAKNFISKIYQAFMTWHFNLNVRACLSETYFELNLKLIQFFLTPVWFTKWLTDELENIEIRPLLHWFS